MTLLRSAVLAAMSYDPDTGTFWWIRPSKMNPYLIGTMAGTVRKGCNGRPPYRWIRFQGGRYKSANLAWLVTFDEWPVTELDHKDGNSLNDAILNLRPCINPQNQANRKKTQNKRLPKGVTPNASGFRARIGFNKKVIHIGTFPSPEEAADAYMQKAVELYGEFARESL